MWLLIVVLVMKELECPWLLPAETNIPIRSFYLLPTSYSLIINLRGQMVKRFIWSKALQNSDLSWLRLSLAHMLIYIVWFDEIPIQWEFLERCILKDAHQIYDFDLRVHNVGILNTRIKLAIVCLDFAIFMYISKYFIMQILANFFLIRIHRFRFGSLPWLSGLTNFARESFDYISTAAPTSLKDLLQVYPCNLRMKAIRQFAGIVCWLMYKIWHKYFFSTRK